MLKTFPSLFSRNSNDDSQPPPDLPNKPVIVDTIAILVRKKVRNLLYLLKHIFICIVLMKIHFSSNDYSLGSIIRDTRKLQCLLVAGDTFVVVSFYVDSLVPANGTTSNEMDANLIIQFIDATWNLNDL